jgi:hypothetical protein
MKYSLNSDIDSIWEGLNTRLHSKFGYAEEISKSASSGDLNWARMILPAYINWDKMKTTRMMLEFWKRKVDKHFKNFSEKPKNDKANSMDKAADESSASSGANETDENSASEVGVGEMNELNAGKILIFYNFL